MRQVFPGGITGAAVHLLQDSECTYESFICEYAGEKRSVASLACHMEAVFCTEAVSTSEADFFRLGFGSCPSYCDQMSWYSDWKRWN